jgi:hypothetical protein
MAFPHGWIDEERSAEAKVHLTAGSSFLTVMQRNQA